MQKWNTGFWGITIIVLTFLFVLTKNDPFFGDSISTISRAANHIYESDFTEISYPQNLDPGHPLSFFCNTCLWVETLR